MGDYELCDEEDYQELKGEVRLWGALLDEDPPAHPAELLEAMAALDSLGELSQRLLKETKVGLILAALVKKGVGEDVKARASALVQKWKTQLRKRQAEEAARAAAPSKRQRGDDEPFVIDTVGSAQLRASVGAAASLSGGASSSSSKGAASSALGAGAARFQGSVNRGPSTAAASFAASLKAQNAGPRPAGSNHSMMTKAVHTPTPARTASRKTSNRGGFVGSNRLSSAASLAENSTDVPTPLQEHMRSEVRASILGALKKAQAVQDADGDLGARRRQKDVNILAGEIEDGLHNKYLETGHKADYIQKTRSINFNLKDPKNTSFGYKILTGRIHPRDLPFLDAEAMASDEKCAERARIRDEASQAIQTDWDQRHGEVHTTGMFTCGKCKSQKTTYYQLQTRKADEPMTTFVQCLVCKKRWRC